MTSDIITISFQKRTNISKTTCEFLCKMLDQDEDEAMIRNISQLTSGQKKKLKVEEANILVRRLLQSILVNDDLDESIVTENEVEPETEGEHETESESENEADKTIKSGPKPNDQTGPSGIDPNVQSNSGMALPTVIPKIVAHDKIYKIKKSGHSNNDDSMKPICKFFKNGHCNKDEGKCRFLHPKICRKFNQFGGKEDNTKGCLGNCGFFHPNACRSSLKNKTCTYKECRFYHLILHFTFIMHVSQF